MENDDAMGFSNQLFQIWLAKPQKQRVKRYSPTGEELIVADHMALLVESKGTVDAVDREMRKCGFPPSFHAKSIQGFVRAIMPCRFAIQTTL